MWRWHLVRGIRWKVVKIDLDGRRVAPYTGVVYEGFPTVPGAVGPWQKKVRAPLLCLRGWHVWHTLSAARAYRRSAACPDWCEIWEVEVAGGHQDSCPRRWESYWDEKEAWGTFRFVRRVEEKRVEGEKEQAPTDGENLAIARMITEAMAAKKES